MSAALTCVYVTDEAFLPCTAFSIVSLAASAREALDIHVIYTGRDARTAETASAYLSGKGIGVRFTTLPDTEFAGLRRPQSLPLATFGRLLMHKVLPVEPERLLYIDGDTLVDIDVAPLTTMTMSEKTIGAVLDIGRVLIGRREEAQRRLDLGPDGDYFNAGVLLIDWKRWREREICEQALRVLAETPERFTQNDQCALNYVCRGDWVKLDLAWNYQPACVVYEDGERALFHFLGGRKPWIASHHRHPMRFVQRYQNMLADSPWAGSMGPAGLPFPVKDALRIAGHGLSPRYWRNRALYHRTVARYTADARH